ncbi:hypothetical protein KI387_007359, partial [Taxus chinensis]
QNFPSNSFVEGKKVNFEDYIVVVNVNTTEHPLDDYAEVYSFFVAVVNVDQVSTAAARDSRIDIVELLQSVFGNINKTFIIIKNWKAYSDGTWSHLQNDWKELIIVSDTLARNTSDIVVHEEVKVLKNMIDM